jgi:hypothetical protein
MNDEDYGRLAECLGHVLADATFTCGCADSEALRPPSTSESGCEHAAGENI